MEHKIYLNENWFSYRAVCSPIRCANKRVQLIELVLLSQQQLHALTQMTMTKVRIKSSITTFSKALTERPIDYIPR